MNFVPGSPLPGPSAAYLRFFSKAYRVSLPASYVAFLEKGNGGVPIENLFLVPKGRERLIERFHFLGDYTQGPLDDYCIEVVLTQLGQRIAYRGEDVGARLVPIAELFAGDVVCLCYEGAKDEPYVVVWDHEQSEDFKPFTVRVADTFSEFLEMTYAKQEE